MTWPTKILLPGGKGLVVGGKFITHAEDCCCEQTYYKWTSCQSLESPRYIGNNKGAYSVGDVVLDANCICWQLEITDTDGEDSSPTGTVFSTCEECTTFYKWTNCASPGSVLYTCRNNGGHSVGDVIKTSGGICWVLGTTSIAGTDSVPTGTSYANCASCLGFTSTCGCPPNKTPANVRVTFTGITVSSVCFGGIPPNCVQPSGSAPSGTVLCAYSGLDQFGWCTWTGYIDSGTFRTIYQKSPYTVWSWPNVSVAVRVRSLGSSTEVGIGNSGGGRDINGNGYSGCLLFPQQWLCNCWSFGGNASGTLCIDGNAIIVPNGFTNGLEIYPGQHKYGGSATVEPA